MLKLAYLLAPIYQIVYLIRALKPIFRYPANIAQPKLSLIVLFLVKLFQNNKPTMVIFGYLSKS
jgi:hypothetical protein